MKLSEADKYAKIKSILEPSNPFCSGANVIVRKQTQEKSLKGNTLYFQIGANGNKYQTVGLNIAEMTASALKVDEISAATVDTANAAIDVIDRAINKVSLNRANLGAMQNRFEHTINNLTTTNENLTAAESAIRDADMASMIVEHTKFNVLQQVAQAMLAQANQTPQEVLQLLR
jgi:flagellin